MTTALWHDLPLFEAKLAGCPWQKHSQTSEKAARMAVEPSKTQRATILALFRERGAQGLTDDEIEVITGYKGSAVRPRRIKLAQDELIWLTRHTRKTRAGRDAGVWKIKEGI